MAEGTKLSAEQKKELRQKLGDVNNWAAWGSIVFELVVVAVIALIVCRA